MRRGVINALHGRLPCEGSVSHSVSALSLYLLRQIFYSVLCSVSKGAIKRMASKDFQDLMDWLFNKGQRIEEVTINNFSGDGTGQAYIRFIGSVDAFLSKEPDVVRYALHIRKTIDSDGNYELVAFKDLEQYYRDIDFLLNSERSKVQRALLELATGRYIFDFDPDQLVEEFLLSNCRKSRKFLRLKIEHFRIVAHCMHAATHALKRCEETVANTPGFDVYYQAIEQIYMKSFRKDANFVKNYILHKTTNDFNLLHFASQIRAVVQHIESIKAIFPTNGMPGQHGIQFLLDSYRRYAEACVQPLNFLRIGQELANGNPKPDRAKSAAENKAILQPALGSLLDCYDPRIRNAESHLGTEVDVPNGQVRLYKEDRGRRELLVTYSFVELINMTNALQHCLFLALAFTADLEWRTMLLVLTHSSPEYKLALLKIGN